MKTLLMFILLFSPMALSQDAIPAGTILPLQLNSSFHSNKVHLGQKITARLMQDVPLSGHPAKIREGAQVVGHVTAIQPASQSSGAAVSLRFDTVNDHGHRYAVVTNLRALATMMDVSEAQLPETGPDRGTSQDNWTTNQIGGEVVYRPGQVEHGSSIVGKSMFGTAVLARVAANPAGHCRGDVEGNNNPQAFWVFSSNACGVYDYPNLKIEHAGRTDPVGEIRLVSTKGDVSVRGGSGMLLRVTSQIKNQSSEKKNKS